MSSTTEVVALAPDHLDQLTDLLNAHLDAVVPGFALPAAYLADRLTRDPGEAIVDPWVVRRRTLVAVERDRVVAAAHLLRYGATPDVGPAFRNVGEIAWLVAWPSAREAAEAVLAAGLRRLADGGAEAPWLMGDRRRERADVTPGVARATPAPPPRCPRATGPARR
jgi:hypothetical protein